MRKYLFPLLIIVLLATATESFGANYYVRKGATGTNKGTDWTNAWNEMNQINFSTVACGDTIWLAGGTYNTTLTAVKNCSSGSTLYIKRVLSSDSVPTAAAGWNSSFDSQVQIVDWSGYSGIRLNGINNVTIDGRFGNPLGTSPVTYGILLHCATQTSCDGINDGASNNNYNVQNVEVYGPPCVMSQSCTNSGASGINLTWGGSGFTYTNVYVHQQGEALRASGWSNAIIQKSFICCTHNDNIQHEDVFYDNGGTYAVNNVTWRYNTIWSSPNDGLFFDFGGQNGFYFYGNVYYHSGGQLMTFKSVGTKATNIFLYNNIFENDGTFGDFQPGWIDFTNVNTSTGAFQNNIMQQMSIVSTPPSPDYNAFDICGNKDSGAHSICYSSATQFTTTSSSNPLLANFRLATAGLTTFANGKTLSAPYNMDMDGNTRGTGGHWYIGAFQGGTSSTPGIPVNLSGAPH
jgi:hypothetical protein